MITEAFDLSLRAAEVFDIPLGAVLHDTQGEAWVFVGWGENTVGKEAVFTLSMEGRRVGYLCVRNYFVARAETLARKMPGVSAYRRPPEAT